MFLLLIKLLYVELQILYEYLIKLVIYSNSLYLGEYSFWYIDNKNILYSEINGINYTNRMKMLLYHRLDVDTLFISDLNLIHKQPECMLMYYRKYNIVYKLDIDLSNKVYYINDKPFDIIFEQVLF